MKKNIIGILMLTAIITIFFAFRVPGKTLTNISFHYVPPTTGDYSQISVQNTDNWVSGAGDCNDEDMKACQIEVASENTTDGGTKLSNSVAISTSTANSSDYFVAGGTNVVSYINKD
ncbi:MAG: hypothetical protein QM640_07325 [Niabella sp.]